MNFAEKKYFPWEATDVNGVELNLYKSTYEMMGCQFNVMIKKGLDLKSESYDLLRGFDHDNAVELLDYYTDSEKRGCLVVSEVNTSFEIWFQSGGSSLLFDQSGHMTNFFKDMIIGLCSLVGSLTKKKLIIETFHRKNLYFSMASQNLCLLLTHVKRVKVLGIVDENHNWDHIRGFINWCAEKCGVTKDHLTESFCQYIGKSYYKVENLKAYPDNWDYRKKGEYLMSLVVTDHAQMRIFLGAAEIDWPYQSKHRVYNNLPILLRKIIDWEEGNNRKYSTLDAMNYIILLRNLYKHYDQLPEEIKAILIDRKALIEMIEHWTPGIWMKIYERAGWPQY